MKAIFLVLAVILIQTNAQLCIGDGEVANWKDNICIRPQYIEGCLSYANADRCAKCEFLYAKTPQGACTLKPLEEVKQCCQNKVGLECSQCKAGLMLGEQGKCQELNIDGCIEKDYKNGKCRVCSSQFSLIEGICQRAVVNCLEYTNAEKTECKTCASDFSLISNTCVKNTILGCRNQVNGICRSCYQPFELVESGKCIIQNCKSYNDFGCTACECGFFITENSICRPVREGCVRYVRGKCIDCLPSWRLTGDVCTLPGCKSTQTANGVCKQCKQGFELSETGRCAIANCLQEGEDFCYKCEAGFIQKSGKCSNPANNSNNIISSTSR